MSFQRNNPVHNASQRVLRGMESIPWGIDFLDDALLGIPRTDLNLLGAGTGVGKTQVASHIALNASRKGKHVLFLALEAEAGEIEDRLLWSVLCREWWKRNPQGKKGVHLRYIAWRMGHLEDELFKIEQEIIGQFNVDKAGMKVLYQERGKSFTLSDFLKLLDEPMEDYDLIVADHIHYFDFEDDNENRGMKRAMQLIRERSQIRERPILLLSHLRKLGKSESPLPDIDDFMGSSDIPKIGINVVLLARANYNAPPTKIPNWIYLPKSRHAGDSQGLAGLVTFDLKTGNYSPGYVLHKAERWKGPEEIPIENQPPWARRAVPSGIVSGPPRDIKI